MKVLLAIKPQYIEKIFSKEKKFEYRKNIFKNKKVDTVIIYSTAPVKKIVGEFKIKRIIKDSPCNLWELAPKNTGIAKEKFYKYFENKKEGYAIEIGDIKKYKKYKELKDFSLKTAPQSFIYIP